MNNTDHTYREEPEAFHHVSQSCRSECREAADTALVMVGLVALVNLAGAVVVIVLAVWLL